MDFNITENDNYFIENLAINLKEIINILKRNLLYDNSLKNIFNKIKYINSDINEDVSIKIIKDNIHSLFPLLICSFLKKNSTLSMVNFSDIERDEIFYFINDFVFNQYYFDIKYNASFQANDYISNLYLTLFNTIKSNKEVNVFSINNYAFLNDVDGLMYKKIMNKLIFENKNFNLNDYGVFNV